MIFNVTFLVFYNIIMQLNMERIAMSVWNSMSNGIYLFIVGVHNIII